MIDRRPRKWLLLVGLPAVVAAAFGALAIWSVSATASSKPVAYTQSVAADHRDTANTVHTRSLGSVHGRVDLRPAGLTARTTWVVFAVDGRRRLVKTIDRGPFVLHLDTRTAPNGAYTISTIVYSRDRAPVFGLVRLVVANPAIRPSPMPTMTIRPSATPLAAQTVQPTPPARLAPAAVPTAAPTAQTRLSDVPTATFPAPQKF